MRPLGGGSRYEAYLAWDDDLYSLVVAKVVRPDRVDDEASLRGLRGEVAVLERLSHPVIVRAFGAVTDGPRPHVVLEFLDGPRLSTLIRRSGVEPEQLFPLALQMCSALHYMSVRGVLHLDLKPRNVIMAGPPRLIDLSVARRVEEVPAITSPIGTDAYMAPEQCVPERFGEIGPPADVWGLGVTLYEALTAQSPFAAARRRGVRHPQVGASPAPLPDRRRLPPALADAVLSCLAPEPSDRPTAAQLARSLEPLVDAVPRPRLGMFRPGGRRPR
ncbi:MAG: serine/threonine-protein kinase [Thermoleophilia bacterium]